MNKRNKAINGLILTKLAFYMSLAKTELLNDLFVFCNDNHYQLLEEYQRIKAAYGQKITFPAFCVSFYATLNDLTDEDRQHYDDDTK